MFFGVRVSPVWLKEFEVERCDWWTIGSNWWTIVTAEGRGRFWERSKEFAEDRETGEESQTNPVIEQRIFSLEREETEFDEDGNWWLEALIIYSFGRTWKWLSLVERAEELIIWLGPRRFDIMSEVVLKIQLLSRVMWFEIHLIFVDTWAWWLRGEILRTNMWPVTWGDMWEKNKENTHKTGMTKRKRGNRK